MTRFHGSAHQYNLFGAALSALRRRAEASRSQEELGNASPAARPERPGAHLLGVGGTELGRGARGGLGDDGRRAARSSSPRGALRDDHAAGGGARAEALGPKGLHLSEQSSAVPPRPPGRLGRISQQESAGRRRVRQNYSRIGRLSVPPVRFSRAPARAAHPRRPRRHGLPEGSRGISAPRWASSRARSGKRLPLVCFSCLLDADSSRPAAARRAHVLLARLRRAPQLARRPRRPAGRPGALRFWPCGQGPKGPRAHQAHPRGQGAPPAGACSRVRGDAACFRVKGFSQSCRCFVAFALAPPARDPRALVPNPSALRLPSRRPRIAPPRPALPAPAVGGHPHRRRHLNERRHPRLPRAQRHLDQAGAEGPGPRAPRPPPRRRRRRREKAPALRGPAQPLCSGAQSHNFVVLNPTPPKSRSAGARPSRRPPAPSTAPSPRSRTWRGPPLAPRHAHTPPNASPPHAPPKPASKPPSAPPRRRSSRSSAQASSRTSSAATSTASTSAPASPATRWWVPPPAPLVPIPLPHFHSPLPLPPPTHHLPTNHTRTRTRPHPRRRSSTATSSPSAAARAAPSTSGTSRCPRSGSSPRAGGAPAPGAGGSSATRRVPNACRTRVERAFRPRRPRLCLFAAPRAGAVRCALPAEQRLPWSRKSTARPETAHGPPPRTRPPGHAGPGLGGRPPRGRV